MYNHESPDLTRLIDKIIPASGTCTTPKFSAAKPKVFITGHSDPYTVESCKIFIIKWYLRWECVLNIMPKATEQYMVCFVFIICSAQSLNLTH
jgi:hypothetical protein